MGTCILTKRKNNRAKGRTSYDSNIGNNLVEFINRNVTPYPTEAGGPKFDLIPVERQKDIMVNIARDRKSTRLNSSH